MSSLFRLSDQNNFCTADTTSKGNGKETESEEEDRSFCGKKSVLLWSLMVAYMVSQTSYLNVYALLPIYMEKHFNFTAFHVGLILSSY
jgi:hypothetical protein